MSRPTRGINCPFETCPRPTPAQPPACEGARGRGWGPAPCTRTKSRKAGGASREPLGCGTPRFLKALRFYCFRHEGPTPLGSISDHNGGPCNERLRLRNLVHRSRDLRAMKSPALAGLRQSANRKLALRNRTLFALALMPRVPEGASACLGASAGILAAGPVEASYTHFVIRVARLFW
jgi:hypothetical protein